jgi:hypothetical protein
MVISTRTTLDGLGDPQVEMINELTSAVMPDRYSCGLDRRTRGVGLLGQAQEVKWGCDFGEVDSVEPFLSRRRCHGWTSWPQWRWRRARCPGKRCLVGRRRLER